MRHDYPTRLMAVLLGALVLAGCGTQKLPPPSAPLAATDPCAERLHEISGQLLLYYATNHRLPQKLQDLRSMPGGEPSLSFTCPVSGLAYVYRPGNTALVTNQGRVVLYDVRPVHSGMRWGLVWDDTDGEAPRVVRVVALPESAFAKEPTSRP